MLTLFYSPHMTSVDNETGHASGHADVPLSAAGHKQALELRQHYATEMLDVVFSSDLQRASRTAEIAFSGRNLPLLTDARLRECDYGDLTQCPVALIDQEFPQRLTTPFPNGQSVAMVVQGVGTFLREILRDYNGKMVVVIGHRATRYGLEHWLRGASLEEIVNTPWEWRDIPIWRYELDAHHLQLFSDNNVVDNNKIARNK